MGGFSGSYSENGKIATKRANHFSQPEPYNVSILHLILPLVFCLIAINSLPTVIDFISHSMPNSSSGSLSSTLSGSTEIVKIVSFFNYYIAPIYGFFIICSIFSKIIKANKEEEHLNTTVYPEELKRYNKHVL